MMNTMVIDGHRAVIKYDDTLEKFRGEFIELNGGAEFYATTVEDLKREGQLSLQTYLDVCREEGIDPHKTYSGKFNLRVHPKLHAATATMAAAESKSLNQYINDLLESMVNAEK